MSDMQTKTAKIIQCWGVQDILFALFDDNKIRVWSVFENRWNETDVPTEIFIEEQSNAKIESR